MVIADRIRGRRRNVSVSKIVTDIARRDIGAIGNDVADVVRHYDDLRAAAAGAVEQLVGSFGDVADKAGDEAAEVAKNVSRFDLPRVDLSKVDLPKVDLPKVDLGRLDVRPDELVERIRRAVPRERIAHLVENLERDLPTTDKGRYDRAYARGWARARTSFVIVGAAAGIAAGVAGAFLLDPKDGPRRRAALRAKLDGSTRRARSTVTQAASQAGEKARAIAAERGIGSSADPAPASGVEAPPAPLVPVMDVPQTAPDLAPPPVDSVVSDPAS